RLGPRSICPGRPARRFAASRFVCAGIPVTIRMCASLAMPGLTTSRSCRKPRSVASHETLSHRHLCSPGFQCSCLWLCGGMVPGCPRNQLGLASGVLGHPPISAAFRASCALLFVLAPGHSCALGFRTDGFSYHRVPLSHACGASTFGCLPDPVIAVDASLLPLPPFAWPGVVSDVLGVFRLDFRHPPALHI